MFSERCVFDGRIPHNFSDFTYGKVQLLCHLQGPGVASSPCSLPGNEATLGGAPICEGAGTHTSIIETDIKYTPCRVSYLNFN